MTRLIQFANNATSYLSANLSAVGLTLSLTPGEGTRFPSLTGGQVFYGTLVKASGVREIVKVTARSSDTLTIVRAVEAIAGVQTAYAFTAGDKFELRMTAGSLASELDRLDAAAFLESMNKSANYTVLESDISKLVRVDTSAGNVTITLPLISTLTGSFEIQVTKATGDANTVTVTRAGADTINGLNTYALSSQYQCVWVVADLTTNTWTAITSASASNKVVDAFTGAGSDGPFMLSGDPGTKNNTEVFVGGVYQQKSTYTVVGTALTLGGVVGVGVPVECLWSQPLPIGTPSDLTVSTAKIIDGGVTTAKIADGAVTTDKLGDIASINGGQLGGLRNRVINGGMQIVQYPTTYYVSNTGINQAGFTIDRWFGQITSGSTGSGTSTYAQSLQPFTLGQTTVPGEPTSFLRTSVTAIGTAGGLSQTVRTEQKIESVRTFAGQTVTCSFWAKSDTSRTMALVLGQSFGTGGSPSAPTGVGQTFAVTTAWQKFSVTFTVPSIAGKTIGTNGNDFLSATFFLYKNDNAILNDSLGAVGTWVSGQYLDLALVQLELGSVATLFEHRPYGMELALCQRYFQPLNVSIRFYSTVSSYSEACGNYAVPMRATPTVTNVTPGTIANLTSVATSPISASGWRSEALSAGAGDSYVLARVEALSAEL